MPGHLRTVAYTLAFLVVAVPAPARAEGKSAQQLYDEGLKQTKAGDARAALTSFRASYDKQPQPRVLYAIAQACARVGDGACAVRSYQQYLREGGKEITPKKKKEVDAEIASLTQTLASLVIKSNVEGADVTVDDVAVGKTPLADPVYVAGGKHKVVIVAKDKKTEQNVSVVAGETSNVQVDVTEEAPPPAAPPPKPEEEKKHDDPNFLPAASPHQGKPFPLVPWAITGGLALGTAVTGILAAGAYSSFKDTKSTYPVTRDELDSAQGSARDLFLVSAILGTGTVISAGIAAWITWGPDDSSASKKKGAASKVNVAIGPRGVAVVGVWP